MSAIKNYLQETAEMDDIMCEELITSFTARAYGEELRYANFMIAAKEIMIRAIKNFWHIQTDGGDTYIIEAEEHIFSIEPGELTFRSEKIEGGGGKGGVHI